MKSIEEGHHTIKIYRGPFSFLSYINCRSFNFIPIPTIFFFFAKVEISLAFITRDIMKCKVIIGFCFSPVIISHNPESDSQR